MPMLKEKGLGLDSKRLVTRAIAISPNRDQYFMDIIKKFKEKFPLLKIIYANNMMGARLDPQKPNADFVLVIQGKIVSKDPRLKPRDIIIVDSPMIFTERSIAGWTMAVEQGNMDGYFAYMFDKALRIDIRRFYEYIEHYCLLSLDPANPLYWKKPENTDALVKDLEELHARYTKKSDNTVLSSKRGYTPTPKTPAQQNASRIKPQTTTDPQAAPVVAAASNLPKTPPVKPKQVVRPRGNRAM